MNTKLLADRPFRLAVLGRAGPALAGLGWARWAELGFCSCLQTVTVMNVSGHRNASFWRSAEGELWLAELG